MNFSMKVAKSTPVTVFETLYLHKHFSPLAGKSDPVPVIVKLHKSPGKAGGLPI
jgi:hypothetical protein